MVTCVFPGQGSQFKGMGQDLFQDFPALTEEANNILGYSIQTLCIDDPYQQLSYTQYTQPALYIVNAFAYFRYLESTVTIPSYLAGHSLGEYNALLAAKVFDFATGLRMVKKRGELMSHAKNGAMIAILKLTAKEIKSILRDNAISDVVIAAYNSFQQIVVSCKQSKLSFLEAVLEKAGGVVIPLDVSGAFHSPFMQFAAKAFIDYLSRFNFSAPKTSVIANVDAKLYRVDNIKEKLTLQITRAVRWSDTIKYLLSRGENTFDEIGPGQSLTNLIKRIKKGQ